MRPYSPRSPVSTPVPHVPCGYCYQRWATVWDHINPVCNGGGNEKSNLHPSCERCNLLLSGGVYHTLRDKREHVRDRLIARGLWIFPEEEPEPPEPDSWGIESEPPRSARKRYEAEDDDDMPDLSATLRRQ